MALKLSNSEMKQYRRCKRQWYLGTYRRLKPRVTSEPMSPLSVGNLTHDALAAYYDPNQRINPITYIQNVIAEEKQANPEWDAELDKEAQLVTTMIEGYMEWLEETGADSDIRVTGVETMIDIPIREDVHLITKLDAPVERISDGAKLALEHKSTTSLNRPLAVLKLDTQLLTEHLCRYLHAQQEGATPEEAYEQCQGILYNQLRKVLRTPKSKPPYYQRDDVIHNINELNAHWWHVLAIAEEILETQRKLDAGGSHHTVCPPNPTKDCTWDCDFFKVCVMFDDGSNAENAVEALYEQRDPLERYDGAVLLNERGEG